MFSHYFAHYAFDRDSDAWQIGFRDFPSGKPPAINAKTSNWRHRKACWPPSPPRWMKVCPARPFPLQADELRVHLPALVALKIELHNAMLRKNTGKAALARKLGFNGGQMERLLDIGYASKVEALEQALYLLGYDVRVTISEVCQ